MTAIAIVGSRAASHYGLEAATEIGHDLAAAGVVVVSGMARGVDGAAHRGALAAGGRTVAVLGCGTDIAYPPEHADLADDIAAHGALVSEYPPGTIPQAFFFPVRNRIISGLARGVLVVEAADRSGSLITAAAALEQGREVMAVPGSVLTDRHHGAHALIRDGATLITGVEDVLASLGRLPLGETRARPPMAPPATQYSTRCQSANRAPSTRSRHEPGSNPRCCWRGCSGSRWRVWFDGPKGACSCGREDRANVAGLWRLHRPHGQVRGPAT